jgi:hypothetical protein
LQPGDWLAGVGGLGDPKSQPKTRNMICDHALFPQQDVPGATEIEVTMARRQQRRIVETPTEARQGEPGPSVLALLTISTGLAILILGVVWFVFFRT